MTSNDVNIICLIPKKTNEDEIERHSMHFHWGGGFRDNDFVTSYRYCTPSEKTGKVNQRRAIANNAVAK
jgi:hypothetical protein